MNLIARKLLSLIIATLGCVASHATPSAIDSLAMRITDGSSLGRIEFRKFDAPAARDSFRISASIDGRVMIQGNNYISMAVGLNHYLKYVAKIHISWSNPSQQLPSPLPLPSEPIARRSTADLRYYLNYCTFSYSMAFWTFDRWEREIDWMALHGVNMPLMLVGAESVWRATLRRLGYPDDAIRSFIAGPAYQAWWLMNNLEGWGGPISDARFDSQLRLAQNILSRMRSLGMSPVLPGYSGMVPRDIGERLGWQIADPGTWCGFPRPAFLNPASDEFARIADIYYAELSRLLGTSDFYAIDPFHEGAVTDSIDVGASARAICSAMLRANPRARWVVQSWQENPLPQLMDAIDPDRLIILDLYSEKRPKWNRDPGYGDHSWIYCMLLNFGGNTGMHGRIRPLIDGWFEALASPQGRHLVGIGATPEGIENNPLMFELLYELPWLPEKPEIRQWIDGYLMARYSLESLDPDLSEAFDILASTVYDCPVDYPGEGTVESLICARPSLNLRSASTWGSSELYYDPDSTIQACHLFIEALKNGVDFAHPNAIFDHADLFRQAVADDFNRCYHGFVDAYNRGDIAMMECYADTMLGHIECLDMMLLFEPSLQLSTWLDQAERSATNPDDARLNQLNALQLVTVWGDSVAANERGLHDYSHREWSGLLRGLYGRRWQAFFDHILDDEPAPDYYQIELDFITTLLNQ